MPLGRSLLGAPAPSPPRTSPSAAPRIARVPWPLFRSLGRGAAGAAAAWCPLCRLSGPNKRPCLSWASKTEARSPPADGPSLETGTRRAGALTPSTLWLAGASGPETQPRGSRAWAWLRDSLGRLSLGKPLAPFCPGKLGWKEPCPCSGPQCLPESRSCPEGLHTPDSQRGPSGGAGGLGPGPAALPGLGGVPLAVLGAPCVPTSGE